VVGVALLFVLAFGWYVVSGQIDRRRGAALARYAFARVRPLGTARSPIWLRGGGCRFDLENIRPPFRRIQVVVRPAPRSWPIHLPWLQPSADAGDLIGLAIDLVGAPAVTLDLIDPETAVGRRALRRAGSEGWPNADWRWAGRPMRLLAPDLASAQVFLRRSPRYSIASSLQVVRLALQPAPPNLSVTLAAIAPTEEPENQFARWLARLADSAVQSSPGGMV
jgi:hypothetical protein